MTRPTNEDPKRRITARARGADEPAVRPRSAAASLSLHLGVFVVIALAIPEVWSRAMERRAAPPQLTVVAAQAPLPVEPDEPELEVEEEVVDPFDEFELVEVVDASFDPRTVEPEEPEPLERAELDRLDVPSRLKQKRAAKPDPTPPASEPTPDPAEPLASAQPDPPAVVTTRILPSPVAGRCEDPAYPRQAQRRKLTGIVVCLITVTVEGEVRAVTIETSSGHGVLDRAALKAVEQWQFNPGTSDGVPQEMVVRKRFAFQLPS